MPWWLFWRPTIAVAFMEIARCLLASIQVERSSSAFDSIDEHITKKYTGRYMEIGDNGNITLAGNCTTWIWHDNWPILVFKRRSIDRFCSLVNYELCAIHKTTLASFMESVQGSEQMTEIRFNSEYEWISAKQAPRKPESIVAAPVYNIIADAKTFVNSRKRYADLGIPYRRGYLFEGMPGTGKSSCALCLAGELRMPLCYMNITGERCSDAWLLSSMSKMPDRSVVLFDDFDRVDLTIPHGVTLSGILNALDGAVAQTGKIVVIAVNDSTTLNQAILRPGRIDRRFDTFSFLSKEEATELYIKFHGDVFASMFHDNYPGLRTAAAVVSHLMRFDDAKLAAVEVVNL